MDLEDLLFRYFGTTKFHELSESARDTAIERMLVDFGLSQDRNNRFALWSLLHLFGASPDLDVAFPDPSDRDAARNFMDLLSKAEGAGE